MYTQFSRYSLLLLLAVSTSSAQFFYFGRNKVQYTDFEWHVLKTEHFDIYYYPEMKELAERGAFIAEQSYTELEQKFNHNVQVRVPLIFYSSHLHFQQTNVTPGFIPEGVGGFFEFLKGRVVIPYNGSMWDFHHVIRHELVHVFMHSKISRVLSDHRQTQDRLPPLWFVEGLAEAWSIDWDVQGEMVMRDAVVSNYLVPLDDMDRIYGTFLMYKEGQNILQYIIDHYGEEKILLFLENFWKSNSFEDVFRLTVGKNYKEFDEEWTYGMKKKYYPILAEYDQPSGASKAIVTTGFNAKPVFFTKGKKRFIYFIGNQTGYTGVWRKNLNEPLSEPELVIEGEKTDEFEAFHLFQSKMDISKDGVLAFVTKSGENDALHLYDTEQRTIIQTLRFTSIVVIGSPSWSPDGSMIVFSGIDKTGSSDLYIWDLGRQVLTRLTNDFYDDRDPAWSPAGDKIAFSSDRTSYGQSGKYNLFLYDTSSHRIGYLTSGDNSYSSPAWMADGRALVFTSDMDDARNVWMMTLNGKESPSPTIRKITHFTTGAFDPAPTDSAGLVFTAFENFSFQIRMVDDVMGRYDSSAVVAPAGAPPLSDAWKPSSLAAESEMKALKYTGEYSLDVAQSQISTDPVFGTAGGAFLALSDVLGNDQYYFLIYNTAQSQDELFQSFNIAISRISLHKRANYAYGIFRFTGRRYDLTDPDLFFYENVFGGYFSLSYPLSKFKRIEVTTSLSNSDKEVFGEIRERKALFLSDAVSFVHDNSLWGPSGPIDGSRYNLTLAYTTDIQFSNANYYSIIADYRRYMRLGQRTAYAARFWIFFNDGVEARRFFMGGSWDLRGYPRWSLRGKKLWLTSHELRFPFIDQFAIRFPFGGVTFAGFRGALFFDAGSTWDNQYEETLGSIGGGVRFNIGGFLVLRYDVGKRIENDFHTLQQGLFNQFFFGWDF